MFAVAVLVAVGVPSAVAWRAYAAEVAVFFPKTPPLLLPMGKANIEGLRQVTIPTRIIEVSAWYAPSTNGATLIFCHGAGGDRFQLIAEARTLAREGFGILLFDWPGHGNTGGRVTWGTPEQEMFTGIVDWLALEQSPRKHALGAIGFSLGGYVLTQVAVADPRVRAMALIGTPSNLNDQVRLAHQRWRLIRETSARWALRNNGLDLDGPQPAQVIARFAPRPVLVVGGTKDTTVPLELTEQLFRAARQPKQLWLIDGAGHGQQVAAGGNAYLGRLVEHFREALLQP